MRIANILIALFVLACGACKRDTSAPATNDTQLDGAIGQIDVGVGGDGGITIDGRNVVDDADVVAHTREAARATPVLHAVIHVDEGVAYERVITTMDALKRGGVVHMTFAVAGTLDASR